MTTGSVLRRVGTLLLGFACIPTPMLTGQSFNNFGPGQGRNALRQLKKDIEKHYYDPTFGGIALDSHFKEAEAKLESAQSTNQIMGS